MRVLFEDYTNSFRSEFGNFVSADGDTIEHIDGKYKYHWRFDLLCASVEDAMFHDIFDPYRVDPQPDGTVLGRCDEIYSFPALEDAQAFVYSLKNEDGSIDGLVSCIEDPNAELEPLYDF